MRFSGLDHVGFVVSDLDRSVEWYTRLLGEPPFVRHEADRRYIGQVVGYEECSLEAALWRLPSDAMLELIQYSSPGTTRVDMETHNAGNGHLCLTTADIAADYERLRGHADFRSPEPVEILAGPYQGALVCYLRDPDGITLELVQGSSGSYEQP